MNQSDKRCSSAEMRFLRPVARFTLWTRREIQIDCTYTDLIMEPESENKVRRIGMNMLEGRIRKTAQMFNYKRKGIEL
jgi:hypothetical protein